MGRKLKGASNFFKNFGESYGAVSGVLRDMDMQDIAQAKPEESTGFTAEQGQALEDAARNGNTIGWDESNQRYVVMPNSVIEKGEVAGKAGTPLTEAQEKNQYLAVNKNGGLSINTFGGGTQDVNNGVAPDASHYSTVAQQGVTDFLGKRYEGKITDDQAERARTMAMAGIYAKYGDVDKAMQLKSLVRQGEREDKRFGWEEDRANREKAAADRAEAERVERAGLVSQLSFFQKGAAFNKEMDAYEQAMTARQQPGFDPNTPLPVKPARQSLTMGDTLKDTALMLGVDAKYGKYDPNAWMALSEKMQKVKDEGYGFALKAALAQGATPESVAAAFNKHGDMQAAAKDIKLQTIPGKDGKPGTTLITKGGVTVDALAELDALNQADQVFKRFYDARSDKREGDKLVAQRGLMHLQGKALEAEAAKDNATAKVIRDTGVLPGSSTTTSLNIEGKTITNAKHASELAQQAYDQRMRDIDPNYDASVATENHNLRTQISKLHKSGIFDPTEVADIIKKGQTLSEDRQWSGFLLDDGRFVRIERPKPKAK